MWEEGVIPSTLMPYNGVEPNGTRTNKSMVLSAPSAHIQSRKCPFSGIDVHVKQQWSTSTEEHWAGIGAWQANYPVVSPRKLYVKKCRTSVSHHSGPIAWGLGNKTEELLEHLFLSGFIAPIFTTLHPYLVFSCFSDWRAKALSCWMYLFAVWE